ncbi:hypothetical protein ATG71_3774 [Bacillus sp. es.034]|nr:hypothetical protein ATG71_3774 [Bacillus sp. es.034]
MNLLRQLHTGKMVEGGTLVILFVLSLGRIKALRIASLFVPVLWIFLKEQILAELQDQNECQNV